MVERYAHVLVPDDPVHHDSRSAILMVARELVRAHRARGIDAHLVASRAAVGHATDEPVWPVMRGKLGGSAATRARGVLEGRLLGRRPSLARTYQGLESLTETDVVLVHNRLEGLRASPGGAFRVLYLHNEALRRYSPRELRGLTPHVDLVVCVSRALVERVPDALEVPRAVVLNGVDGDLFRPAAHPRGEGAPTVLYCGRVIPEKGVHLLVQAAAKLRHLDFRVRLVGSGVTGNSRLSRYERRLRELAHRAGITGRLTFERAQPRAAIAEIMRTADVLSVPSVWPDPCPLVVLEGLASGLPVLAARTGGIPELGGSACWYHEPDDVDDLTGQLETLLLNPGLRSAIASTARSRGEQLSWAAAEEQLVGAITDRAAL